jgi:sugar phosphate isomerase/epimerase
MSYAGTASAMYSLGGSLHPFAMASNKRQPAGIQLYMVKDALEKDPASTLKKLAAFGYGEVETAGLANLSAAEFRKLVVEAGLQCPSAHLFFGFEDTAKLLDDAKALGAHYAVSSVLLSDPPPISGNDFSSVLNAINHLTLDDFKKSAALANHIGEEAKKVGLQYAYHNHNFEFRDYGAGQSGYSVLLNETDPELVKFEADCGWMVAASIDPVNYLQQYPGRYRMIHVKDFLPGSKPTTTVADPDGPKSTELGRGGIQFQPILAAAKHAGIEHYFVEQEPPFTEMTSLEAAKVDLDYIKPLL